MPLPCVSSSIDCTVSRTYNAKRADIVAEFPFAHATLSGFHTMLPPQEKPTHLLAIGAVILRMTSYGSVTVLGRAIPKVVPDSEFEYEE